jgi:hypothetical protein
VIVWPPVAAGVYVTEHEPAASEHEAAENVPDPPLDHPTLPEGCAATPPSVSATEAEHVDATPTWTGVAHVTVAEVVRSRAVTVAPPPLDPCTPSPG